MRTTNMRKRPFFQAFSKILRIVDANTKHADCRPLTARAFHTRRCEGNYSAYRCVAFAKISRSSAHAAAAAPHKRRSSPVSQRATCVRVPPHGVGSVDALRYGGSAGEMRLREVQQIDDGVTDREAMRKNARVPASSCAARIGMRVVAVARECSTTKTNYRPRSRFIASDCAM